MTGRYKGYPKYKESGIEWVGQTPAHWRMVPIKYMALESSSLFIDGDWIESKDISSEGIRYITTGNVGEGNYKEQGAGFISEATFKSLSCTEVFEGDLLISRLNAPIGRACIVPELGCRIVTSVDNVIFRPDSEYLKEYLVYLFSCSSYFKHTSDLARGATMQRISRGLLGNIRTSVPPIGEQQKIADFLDHETAKIDTLIAKQEKLIELLKEKRQAVISRAVTKGLNPNAPMKDSGVEWLGEVPEHWKVLQFRRFTHLSQGLQIPQSDRFYDSAEGRAEYITIKSINAGVDSEFKEYIESSNQRVFCNKSEILLARTGATGEVVTDVEGIFHNNFFKVSFDSNYIIKEFLFNMLKVKELKSHLLMLAGTTTIPDLNHGAFLSTKVTVPSKEEQISIVNEILKKMAVYDSVMTKVQKGILLLKERKNALISGAVTGKIDVRDWRV